MAFSKFPTHSDTSVIFRIFKGPCFFLQLLKTPVFFALAAFRLFSLMTFLAQSGQYLILAGFSLQTMHVLTSLLSSNTS